MWSSKAAEGSKSGGTGTGSDTPQEEKPNTSVLRKPAKISSLVCADYNDFDDDSHTPPQTPPTGLEAKQGSQSSSLASSTLDNGPLDSPGEKLDQLADTTDYDDDKTIVNTEVTLSSAAQRDSDDITVIEQFGDSELVDVISSSLEGDMQEEYVLFEPGMVVDLSADSNDSLCHALVNADSDQGDLVQILEIENPESQSEEPILSDDDLVPSNTRNKKGLRLDIVRTLQAGKKLVTVTDTSESPDQDELRVDPSPGPYLDNSPDQDLMVSLVSESEVVIIDPTTKSPEDNLSKESCDEETEKADGNLLTDVSKDNTVVESLIDDQIKVSHKESKQSKPPTSFVFPEKASYSQPTPSTIHQTNVSVATTSKSSVSSAATSISSILNANLVSVSSHPQVVAQTIATEANTSQDALLNSFSNQKSINLPSTMASIVADAKLAARLHQTVLENISSFQQSKPDTKVSETPKTLPPATTSSAQSEFSGSTSVVESLNKSTKLVLSIQSPSVTLSTPKMTDLLKKESTLKIMERPAESQEGEMKKKTEEEEVAQAKIKDQNVSSSIPSVSVTEEKMSDPLNTTDELESMLEAIHNPAEATTLKDENKSEPVATATTLKRMSPVADDLSLVNILENDAEPADNDKEESSSSSETQKIVNKSKEAESDLKQSSPAKNASPKEKIAEELELENAKPYLQHCLGEEKNSLMEESSDEILDMLQNIISSKPEMANTSELKSSLIYQMPTPLDTLPLNILQDPLMDLDQESLENDQLSLQQESKSQPAKSLNSEAKKSPPAPNQAVAQLQKSTTTVPHLSPLSKPTELTSNVAHVTDQLRTLLSSLQSNQTTGNQTGVVTMVSSVKPGSVLSATSTFSTSNSLISNVPTLSRLEQSRPQVSVSATVAKEPELTVKDLTKESTGITSTVSKVHTCND